MITSLQLSKNPGLGRKLDLIGHGFIVSLPVAMVFANRSSPLFLSCAAVFIAAASLVSGSGKSWSSALRRVHKGPFIGLLGAIAYALVSLTWTVRPGTAFLALGEAVVPIVASVVLILRWRLAAPPQWLFSSLAKAMLIAAALIAVELLLDAPLRQIYGGRLGGYVQNRPVVTLLLLLWPVLSWAMLRDRRKLGLALLASLATIIFISDSEAAKLGLLAAAGATLLVYAFSEWISRLFIVALLSFIWIQPFFGDIVAHLTPARLIELTEAGHSQQRIEIWQAFGEVARKHPLIGTGFASTAHIKDHPVAVEVPPRILPALNMGHPHNAYLQVWVELGIPGALILSWFSVWGIKRLSEAPTGTRRMGLTALMCANAVALVSHGAWQGWWIAAVALVAAMFSIRRQESGQEAQEDQAFLGPPEEPQGPNPSVTGLPAAG